MNKLRTHTYKFLATGLGTGYIEALKGGWGVMADDVAAGIYANIIVHLYLLLAGLIKS